MLNGSWESEVGAEIAESGNGTRIFDRMSRMKRMRSAECGCQNGVLECWSVGVKAKFQVSSFHFQQRIEDEDTQNLRFTIESMKIERTHVRCNGNKDRPQHEPGSAECGMEWLRRERPPSPRPSPPGEGESFAVLWHVQDGSDSSMTRHARKAAEDCRTPRRKRGG